MASMNNFNGIQLFDVNTVMPNTGYFQKMLAAQLELQRRNGTEPTAMVQSSLFCGCGQQRLNMSDQTGPVKPWSDLAKNVGFGSTQCPSVPVSNLQPGQTTMYATCADPYKPTVSCFFD